MQEGSLRFDQKDVPLGKLDSGEIGIVPGKPADSEVDELKAALAELQAKVDRLSR